MMNEAIQNLLQAIKSDYVQWCTRCANARGEAEVSEYSAETIAEWDDKMEVRAGSKYIKILHDRSVWGFVVAVDTDKKFRKGDILKAAGYDAPARNAARGNILEGGYTVQWTGPLYL